MVHTRRLRRAGWTRPALDRGQHRNRGEARPKHSATRLVHRAQHFLSTTSNTTTPLASWNSTESPISLRTQSTVSRTQSYSNSHKPHSGMASGPQAASSMDPLTRVDISVSRQGLEVGAGFASTDNRRRNFVQSPYPLPLTTLGSKTCNGGLRAQPVLDTTEYLLHHSGSRIAVQKIQGALTAKRAVGFLSQRLAFEAFPSASSALVVTRVTRATRSGCSL